MFASTGEAIALIDARSADGAIDSAASASRAQAAGDRALILAVAGGVRRRDSQSSWLRAPCGRSPPPPCASARGISRRPSPRAARPKSARWRAPWKTCAATSSSSPVRCAGARPKRRPCSPASSRACTPSTRSASSATSIRRRRGCWACRRSRRWGASAATCCKPGRGRPAALRYAMPDPAGAHRRAARNAVEHLQAADAAARTTVITSSAHGRRPAGAGHAR